MSSYKNPAEKPVTTVLSLPPIVLFIYLFLSSSLLADGGSDARIVAIVKKLKNIDSVYSARCTYEVEETYKAAYPQIWTEPIVTKCVFTVDSASNRRALIKQVISNPMPNASFVLNLDLKAVSFGGFIPIGSPASVRLNSSGNRTISFETGLASRFDSRVSGLLRTQTPFQVGKNEQVRKNAALNCLYLDSATSFQLAYPEKQLLWASGRGFSKFLQEIVSYKSLPNDLIEISARCFESPNNGLWTIVVDPGSTFLVRQARFSQLNEKNTTVEVDTTGTITKGPVCMPKEAVWKDRRTDALAVYFHFKEGRFEFDEAVYRKAEKLISADQPYIPRAFVFDGRLSPEDVFQADQRGYKPNQTEKKGKGIPAAKRHGLTISVTFLFVLLGYWFLRNKSKNHSNSQLAGSSKAEK